MNTLKDNGYISDYLIHWTGKKGDEHGAEILGTIASTLRLLLSYNRLHLFDLTYEIHEKMVCFTDVPLLHSGAHCKRYGTFGVAFQKLKLMNVGTQPVFYATHACKQDMDTIFHFLQEQRKHTTLPSDLFRALHRHFYFIQRLSDERADGHDTFYYEREWRLGEQTLVPEAKLEGPNAKYHAQQEGYPPYTGRLVEKDGKSYFAFDREDIAFLIVPKIYRGRVKNPHRFPVEVYEDLVDMNKNEEGSNRATHSDGNSAALHSRR